MLIEATKHSNITKTKLTNIDNGEKITRLLIPNVDLKMFCPNRDTIPIVKLPVTKAIKHIKPFSTKNIFKTSKLEKPKIL